MGERAQAPHRIGSVAALAVLCFGLAPVGACALSMSPDRQAVQATLYALPLVIMDLTRQEMLAYPGAKPDRFVNRPIIANTGSRTVVRPNVDTLYSSAWLDLSAGPMILTLPASRGRFFVVQCMDAWTNVFADPGTRTRGDKPASYVIVGPDWHGRLLRGVKALRAPTRMVWVLARIYVRNAADLAAARRFQSHLDVRPLSRSHDPFYHSVYPGPLLRRAEHPTMIAVLKRLGAGMFFERFMNLAKTNAPVPRDPRFEAQILAPLGLIAHGPRTWQGLRPSDRRALTEGFELALRMLNGPGRPQRLQPRRVNGWNLPGARPQGSFGRHYTARAVVAMLGLAEALRADALYFKATADSDGEPLDGSREYRLTFPPGQTPPARAFWSLTAYDEQGYLVANPYGRYGVRSGGTLLRQPDGSLVIYLQPRPPVPADRGNWIPTPPGRTYQMTLRCYWPDAVLLQGRWLPPPLVPVGDRDNR